VRLLVAAGLVGTCAAVAGCAHGAEANRAKPEPAALVLTAQDVGAPRTGSGRASLIGETPQTDLNSVLRMSSGHPTWHAFSAQYQSVSIDSLAVRLPSSRDAKRLFRLAPRLARYEGMDGATAARVVRSVPIGDGAVLLRGDILDPKGQVIQGSAVVFREGGVVGQVIAQTDADAIRLAKVQEAKLG
jgi:hypothetical protein